MGIILKGISKSYGGQAVLKNLNLEINQGEFHVLLGPSGGGKTTALSIIVGLIKQDSGSVFIAGMDVSHLSPDKRRIGFVFQDHALFPHLTVFENIAYGLRARKINKQEIKRKVDHYLSGVSIAKEKDKFPHQLSGGQKQRVALARALIIEPALLVMDEPMSSLDAMTKETMRNELKNIQQKTGVTTVYVTHDLDEAAFLGDRISVLNNGKVDQIDSPSRLFRHPKTEFTARFVGGNNILKASVIGMKEHEAVITVKNDGLLQPFEIRVKKYPIFEVEKEINLCIHSANILIKKETEAIGGNFNKIRGSILDNIPNGSSSRVMVDLGGMKLHAAAPKAHSDFQILENVWLCFSPDSLHPLCGKRCRDKAAKRKCRNMREGNYEGYH